MVAIILVRKLFEVLRWLVGVILLSSREVPGFSPEALECRNGMT